MKIHASLLIACALSFAATAAAHDHNQHADQATQQSTPKPASRPAPVPDKSDQEFAQLDKDKDGFLTKSEFPAKHPLAAHFSMIDRNKDRKLDRKEFAAGQSMR